MMKKYIIFSVFVGFGLCASSTLVNGMEGSPVPVQQVNVSKETPVVQTIVVEEESEKAFMKKVFESGMEFYCFEDIGESITLARMRQKQPTGSFDTLDEEVFFQEFGWSGGRHGIWLVVDVDKLKDIRASGSYPLLRRSCNDFDWILGFLKKVVQSYQGDLRIKKIEGKKREVTVTRFDPRALEDKVCIIKEAYKEETVEVRRKRLDEFIRVVKSIGDLQERSLNEYFEKIAGGVRRCLCLCFSGAVAVLVVCVLVGGYVALVVCAFVYGNWDFDTFETDES